MSDTDAPRRRRRPSARLVLTVAALLLVLAVGLLPAPYVIEQPGPVFDTLGTTQVDGKTVKVVQVVGRTTYPTTGALDLLTVTVAGDQDGGIDWLTLAGAYLDPSRSVIPAEEIYPKGVSQQQVNSADAADMTASQMSAQVAALTELGDDVHGTVKVAAIVPKSAAAAVLRTGDTIRTFDGETIADACSLQNAVLAHGAKPATIQIERSGVQSTVTATPRVTGSGATARPLLGIESTSTYAFPFTIRLSLDDVGGPSAGMMFALGIIDELTPGALTGGRHIAGTGTICGDGTVGAIGGIVQKMYGARRAGATVFLAPADNCDEVAGHIPSGLQVYAVRTLKDSLTVLRTLDSGLSTARLPRCSAG